MVDAKAMHIAALRRMDRGSVEKFAVNMMTLLFQQMSDERMNMFVKARFQSLKGKSKPQTAELTSHLSVRSDDATNDLFDIVMPAAYWIVEEAHSRQ